MSERFYKKFSTLLYLSQLILLVSFLLSVPCLEAAETSVQNRASEQAAGTFTTYGGKDDSAAPSGFASAVSLDLRNIDVTEALRFLAKKAGINMAISKQVSGRVQLLLNDVRVQDVFDIILVTNNLAYTTQGGIYYVMTDQEYQARFGRKFQDVRKVKIFKLGYAVPDQVFNAMDVLKSEVGRVLVDQESGLVLVIDADENLKRIEDAVRMLEQPRAMRVFNLQYAQADDVAEQLRPQLDGKNAGTVKADERGNRVVIQTYPERMEAIAKLVASLDTKTKEVLIVAKIVKITLSDNLETEIRWEGFIKNINLFNLNQGFFGNHESNVLARTGRSFMEDFVRITPTTTPTQGSKNELTENVIFGVLGDEAVEILLNFLKTMGESRILSSPKIMVVNNQEAKIHVGAKEAYVTTTTTTGQSTTTTAEEVTFVDTGIQLAVTPTINDDGFVTMKLKPEVSSVGDTLTTPSGNIIPIITTSEAETTAMVKDGTTVVIAGLRQDEEVVSEKRVPWLGDLPLLGTLLRSGSKEKKRDELLVLITPYVVGGDKHVTGEPGRPESAMKPYRDYSAVERETGIKTRWYEPLVGAFKKILFIE